MDGIIGVMTRTLRAKFDGRVLVPEGPVDLPMGQVLEFELRHPSGGARPALMELLEEVSKLPSDPAAPTDAAAQHDHYLYGTPKRDDP